MSSTRSKTVAVLGAGPVGLAAAAHLIAHGFEPLVFEASDAAGASFRDFAQVRLFSPWRYNVDGASRRLLEQHGWVMPDEESLPTAGDLAKHYLVPLAQAMGQRVLLNARVVSVARLGFDKVKSEGRADAPFVVRAAVRGEIREYLADAVIDATGTWTNPNPLGANGLPALGESDLRNRIEYGMPDVLGRMAQRYQGKTVLVVGAGHSAVGSLVALAELAERDVKTVIHWALRGRNVARAFGGGEADQLPARGALGIRLKELIDQGRLVAHTGFRVHELSARRGKLTVTAAGDDGSRTLHGIDEIIGATGARPDLDMLRELRVRTDPLLESSEALAPLIDPNLHSCGTVRPHGHRELAHPEPGFYILGSKSYGRAPTFLMATGYEQARSVVAFLAGDTEAADDVRLELPETGVCITGGTGGGDCCAPPAAAGGSAKPVPSDCGCDAPKVPAAGGCCA